MTLNQIYHDALLEYLALTHLEDELRRSPEDELIGQVSARKTEARDKIARELLRHHK
jgi:hypothetical protein